ncbi:hypothetical protein B0H11DRAFT_1921551 [Mycena galericulata]|nr:hypothetical protein B0H11DRAFT_1921551 [Mycena galericulata]
MARISVKRVQTVLYRRDHVLYVALCGSMALWLYRSTDLHDSIIGGHMPLTTCPFGVWKVESSGNPGSNEYTITNLGLNAATYATSEARCHPLCRHSNLIELLDLKGKIVTKYGQGNSFSVEPAGDDTFVVGSFVLSHFNLLIIVWKIKVPNEDLVWTVDTQWVRAPVHLKPEDGIATTWRFVQL